MDGEHTAREILEAARAQRPRTPRWVWTLAIAVGAACIAAFCYVVFDGASAMPIHPRTGDPDTGLRFGLGVIFGLTAGIGIGYAIARQRRDHSSRSRP